MKTCNNGISQSEGAIVRPCVCPSFYEALDFVKRRINFEDVNMRYRGLALDMCRVIAEVMTLRDDREMQVGGDMIPISTVKAVYKGLSHDHVIMVAENFIGQKELIRNKKAYLRTALYNSYFEIESHYTNVVRHDMG